MVGVAGICVLIVSVMGWLTQLPSRSQEGKGVFFVQLPRGSLEAKMPERGGAPLPRCLYRGLSRANLETSCSGRGPHGQAHTNVPRDAVWGHQLYQPSVPSSWCAAGTISKGTWWTRPPGWKGSVCSGGKYFLQK